MRRSRRLVLRLAATTLTVTLIFNLVVAESPSAVAASAPPEPAPEQQWGTAGAPGLVPASQTGTDVAVPPHEAGRAPNELPADEPMPRGMLPTSDRPGGTVEPAGAQRPAFAGFQPATSVEDRSRRGRQVKEFRNADGTTTTRLFTAPVHYQASDGTWAEIDPTLVRLADGRWRNSGDRVVMVLAPRADAAELASLRFDAEHSVGFGVAGAAPVTGEAQGSRMRYAGVRPHADVELESQPGSLKETLVLSSPQAPDTWVFPLRVDGLTASINEVGNVVFTDEQGAVRAWVPHGWMRDSNIQPGSGEGVVSGGVAYSLVDYQGQPALEVRLDRAWLDDPARVYPVRVDPTLVGAGSGTSYIQQSGSDFWSGTDILKVGTFNGGTDKTASVLGFSSLNSTLRNHTILGAQLYVGNVWSYSCTPSWVSVHRNKEPWAAQTVRYPGPDYGATLAGKSFAYEWADPPGSASPCPRNTMVPLDFNNIGVGVLQDWAYGDLPVHGLTLRASVTDNFAWKKFQRAANNGVFLSVTHTRYGATYDTVGSFDPWPNNEDFGWIKVRVTNMGVDTWTPTNGFVLGHQVVNRDNGQTVRGWRTSAPMPTSVSHGESVTVHAKVEALPPGPYQLRWDMFKVGMGTFSGRGVPMGAVNFDVGNVPPILREVSPQGDTVEGTLTPALHATGEDLDLWPGGSLQYKFKICGGTPQSPSGCAESAWSTQQAWTVPAGTLEWGERYFWRAWVKDGAGAQNPDVGPFWVSTAVPQPAITSHLAAASATARMRGFDPQVGDYVTTATDATVATIGPPLQVNRTYNSLDPRTGSAFGAGWSSPFDMRLVPDADGTGNVVVRLADGQAIRFGRATDGSYHPPSGRFATLLEATATGWTLTEKRGVTYTFEAGGRLIEVADRHGRAQQLAYNPDGTLATATDLTSGRALHFTWTGGHVTRVATDPVGGAPLAWSTPTTATSSPACAGRPPRLPAPPTATPRARTTGPSSSTTARAITGAWATRPGRRRPAAFSPTRAMTPAST